MEEQQEEKKRRLNFKNKSFFNSFANIKEDSGCVYAIIPPLRTKLIKIGSTTTLPRRIHQYHGYYPEGFNVFIILNMPRENNSETDRNYQSRIVEIEKTIQTNLNDTRLFNNNREAGEFFTASEERVYEEFIKVIQAYSLPSHKWNSSRNWNLTISWESRRTTRTESTYNWAEHPSSSLYFSRA